VPTKWRPSPRVFTIGNRRPTGDRLSPPRLLELNMFNSSNQLAIEVATVASCIQYTGDRRGDDRRDDRLVYSRLKKETTLSVAIADSNKNKK